MHRKNYKFMCLSAFLSRITAQILARSLAKFYRQRARADNLTVCYRKKQMNVSFSRQFVKLTIKLANERARISAVIVKHGIINGTRDGEANVFNKEDYIFDNSFR